MPLSSMKRVLLKLSGEVLMGDQQFGIDPARALTGLFPGNAGAQPVTGLIRA